MGANVTVLLWVLLKKKPHVCLWHAWVWVFECMCSTDNVELSAREWMSDYEGGRYGEVGRAEIGLETKSTENNSDKKESKKKANIDDNDQGDNNKDNERKPFGRSSPWWLLLSWKKIIYLSGSLWYPDGCRALQKHARQFCPFFTGLMFFFQSFIWNSCMEVARLELSNGMSKTMWTCEGKDERALEPMEALTMSPPNPSWIFSLQEKNIFHFLAISSRKLWIHWGNSSEFAFVRRNHPLLRGIARNEKPWFSFLVASTKIENPYRTGCVLFHPMVARDPAKRSTNPNACKTKRSAPNFSNQNLVLICIEKNHFKMWRRIVIWKRGRNFF